jgi:hypothetical protein
MKKLFILITLLLFAVSLNAQMYIKLGGGYGTSLTSQEIYSTSTSSSITYNYGSFGAGFNFGGTFGYMLNKNIGIELSGNYLLGKKYDNPGITLMTSTLDEKFYGNAFSITPAFVMATALDKQWTLYTKIGAVFAFPQVFQENNYTATAPSGPSGMDKFKESGSMALGFAGAVGANVMLNKTFGIFFEINGIGLNYSPSTVENTDVATGHTKIPTKTYNETVNTSDVNVLPSVRRQFSSIGASLGISILLGK